MRDLSLRLTNHEFIEHETLKEDNYLIFDNQKFYPYSPLTLSHGLPGLCMLYSELSYHYPDENWMEYCNDYIQKMMKLISENGLKDISMFSGCAGIGLTLLICSKKGLYYKNYQSSIDSYIKILINEKLVELKKSNETVIHDYDVIQGLSGTLNYMLLNDKQEFFDKEIKLVLEYFIEKTEYKTMNDKEVLKWHIPAKNLFLDYEKDMFPDGVLNLGLSHGIAGPLVVMSKAYSNGFKSKELKKSIIRISDTLIRCMDKKNKNWLGMVDINKVDNNDNSAKDVRNAWCYGMPGVSYSLLLASKALESDFLYKTACDLMENGIGNYQGIISPTFCHGYVGLAYLYKIFYKETKTHAFLLESKNLKDIVLTFYKEESPFGFKNIESDMEESNHPIEKELSTIGLLDGVTCILLCLLAIEKDKYTDWDAAFLLN